MNWLPAEALTLPPPPRLDPATPNAAADDTAEDTADDTAEDTADDTVEDTADDADGRPRLLVYLATPALFADGWRPRPQEIGPGLTLVAASVVGPRVITTARPDLVTGAVSNGRLLWAAPAGSVYYLRADDHQVAAELIRACHGRLLTADTPFPQIDDEVITAGFGLALIGRW
ncbi:type III-B CRISPR module-associated protein Cmr3 [Frankia sp. AiPs1]|uniref:type III-B CRISPR module-associated protein Cmr3 n=1 Tax=Frankia sp. AiPs1 TaxID=573493 RepID=UPI002042C86E|nr:type III-B CRISPR module-associated protein Cmr3 [Frankia sp. AiPs1]MCM3926193.1 type III-B CRISPR module-associated protein Cmr3 [Frankia sp. AiPs1]